MKTDAPRSTSGRHALIDAADSVLVLADVQARFLDSVEGARRTGFRWLARNPEIESDDLAVEAAVRDRVKAASGVTPRIVVHAPNTLPTTEFKSRRVVDRRRWAVES